MGLTSESVDWAKQIALPLWAGSSNPLEAWVEQKGCARQNLLPSSDSPWAETLVSTDLQTLPGTCTVRSPGSLAFGLNCSWRQRRSWFLRLQTQSEAPSSGLLEVQPASSRSWAFQSQKSCDPINFCLCVSESLCLFLPLSLSLFVYLSSYNIQLYIRFSNILTFMYNFISIYIYI